MKEKRAIIVASFGTTYVEAMNRCIVPIEEAFKASFPSWNVVRALTSAFVRERLAKHGIEAQSLPDVLERLCGEGYREVIIIPTHIIAGEEYKSKVLQTAGAYRGRFDRLAVGRPLMMHGDRAAEYDELVQALCSQFPPLGEKEAVVLMGHGSRGADNTVYLSLQEAFDARGDAVVVGVLEAYDALSLDPVMERLGKMISLKKVHLMPLLIVAGSHAEKDMRAWRARMQEAGYHTEVYLHGLGENAQVRELYVKRARQLINETK